ncbi:hypothetical protein A3842_07675 [Paenibacillus sp. P3E]|nr:hypothetical protein A3842_07675 [Paenibacillus sp. P3E]
MQRASQRRPWLTAAVLLTAAVAAVAAIVMLTKPQPREAFHGLPHTYSYLQADSSSKVQLHMMSVAPADIVLRSAGTPLRPIAAYGINGGFFYGSDLLSVAILNDRPVNGVQGAYGSGWFNAKYPRGTLVWDGASGTMSVQVVSSGDDLSVTDRGHYWAQGGISMNLQHEELWQATAAAEHLPYADEQRMRSGLVYDGDGKLWLIVTPSRCTAEAFRTAILETVPGEEREGIFLDGDGSSQMNAEEAVLTGDSRPVVQMIAVAGGS